MLSHPASYAKTHMMPAQAPSQVKTAKETEMTLASAEHLSSETQDEWRLQISADRVCLTRHSEKYPHPIEVYRPFSKAEAAVAMAAVLTGFQPPRRLIPVADTCKQDGNVP